MKRIVFCFLGFHKVDKWNDKVDEDGWFTSREGTCTHCNKTVEKSLGYTEHYKIEKDDDISKRLSQDEDN